MRFFKRESFRRAANLFVGFVSLLSTSALFAETDTIAADEPDPKPRVTLPDESGYTASPSDGQGTVTVSPDVVPVRSPVTMTFVYTAGEKGIAPGGGVACNVSKFWGWTPPQDADPRRPGYMTVRCDDPAVALETTVDGADSVIIVRVEKNPLTAGKTLTFVYGDTSDGKYKSARGISDKYSERDERFFFKVDGDGDGWFTPVAKQPTFRVEATNPVGLMAFAPSNAAVNKPFNVSVAVVDHTFNRVESFVGEVRAERIDSAKSKPIVVKITEADRGAARVPVTANSPGVVRLILKDAGGRLVPAITNPTFVSTDAAPKYTLYWADLQGHCNVCDGSASPEEYYEYARDVARLDVVALTDHDHWGYAPLDQDTAKWHELMALSRKYNDPGTFVTFPAYEWTNWTYGHKHVLFMNEDEAKVISWQDPASDHPEKLWKLLGDRDCITVSHHPGGGPIPTFWKYHDPKFEPVVEMASVHGVSEAMGHPRCIYSPEESGMMQSALARGYRLGMMGGGDTHDGHPGLGSPEARAGLAGIYATELTREGIFEALRARRVYATTGCRAILRFHMGGTAMGGVAKLSAATDDRTFSVTVLGDDKLTGAEIVKNNKAVAKRNGGGILMTWEWTDDAPARDGDYYYVRVVQNDGEWIWSSPIFVELNEVK